MIFGAIDIGSNAVRLLIGKVVKEAGNNYVKKLNLIRLPLRLGQEVFETGSLSKPKMEELLQTMEAFKQVMKVYKVVGYQAYATSALREAKNQKEVIQKIKRRTGIPITCIGGDIEAKLILDSFQSQALDFSRDYLCIDVGGGSTELSYLKNGEHVESESFQLGAVRLMNNRVDPEEWVNMEQWIHRLHKKGKRLSALGTGGNINRMLKLSQTKSQGFVTYFELQSLSRMLAAETLEGRMEKYRLREDRADVIVPASQIYLAAMEYGGMDLIQVPKIGLTDGMIYGMYKGAIDSLKLDS